MIKNLIRLFFNKPNYLIFHVTSKCNSKCKTCFNWSILNKKEDLSLDEIKSVSNGVGKIRYLTLGGGEPFLRGDLLKICKLFYENNNTKIFSIVTNALLPQKVYNTTKRILQNCPRATIKLCLSLDGLYKDHDSIRGIKGNFDKFLKTFHLIKNLKKYRNFLITVSTTFCGFNQNKIKNIYEFVEKLDVDIYNINLVRGNPYNPNSKNINIKRYREITNYLEKRYKNKFKNLQNKILYLLPFLSRRLISGLLGGQKRLFNCYALEKFLVLDSIGNIYPCECLDKMIGNIKQYDYNIRVLLSSNRAKEIKKFIKRKKCFCTWECAIQSSFIYDIKKYPKLFKEIYLK